MQCIHKTTTSLLFLFQVWLFYRKKRTNNKFHEAPNLINFKSLNSLLVSGLSDMSWSLIKRLFHSVFTSPSVKHNFLEVFLPVHIHPSQDHIVPILLSSEVSSVFLHSEHLKLCYIIIYSLFFIPQHIEHSESWKNYVLSYVY